LIVDGQTRAKVSRFSALLFVMSAPMKVPTISTSSRAAASITCRMCAKAAAETSGSGSSGFG